MTSKTKSTRGKIIIERTVYTPLHKICTKTGWTAKKISPSDSEISDQMISSKYGKKVNILLTTDKTFFKNNTDDGFIGYVVQELPVDKKDFHKFEQNMEHMLSTNTSKSLRGYQTIVGVDTIKKEKVK